MVKAVRTSYELEQQHAEALKRLAGALGFVQSRGPGKGELPNVSAMLRALSEADHDAAVQCMTKLGVVAEA